MNKFGLKLWSTNNNSYLEDAKKLFKRGFFDYIELYVVPNSLSTIDSWKVLNQEFNIPFSLHAPHFAHGVNLAQESFEKVNRDIFDEVKLFADELKAEYTIIHGGMDGDVSETIRQLKLINMDNAVIENKPFWAPLNLNLKCRGAEIFEIKQVLDEVGCDFCLDVGHAICTANSLKINPYELVSDFNKLNPKCYHLCDNLIDSEIDTHMHLGQGSYDFERIFKIIDSGKNISIETNKISSENLDDFNGDIDFLRGLNG